MEQAFATPTLVLLAGLPGAGKTTLALALSRALGWPVVDKDSFKSPLLDLGVAEAVAGPASYELLFAVGRDLLVGQRLSVILDSPAAYPRCVTVAHDLVTAADARLKVVLCLAERAVRQERIAGRIAGASQPRVLNDTAETGHDRFAHLPAGALILDGTRPLPELVKAAIAYLRDDSSSRLAYS